MTIENIMKYDPQVYGRRVGYYPTAEVFKNLGRSVYAIDRPSDAEYERRHKAIRKFMENKGLDCLVIQDLKNITWTVSGPPLMGNSYLIVPIKGEMTILATWQMLVDPGRRARFIIEDVRGGHPVRDLGRMAMERIKELGYDNGKIGIVEAMPGPMPKIFSEQLPNAKFESVADDWWKELRVIKSSEEIKFMEKAAAIGDKMVEAIVENIRPGMTEADIFAIAYSTMYKNGGESPMLMFSSSNSFQSTSALHRREPQDRVLQKGDTINEEMWVTYSADGSSANTSKPIALGQPSQEYLEMYELGLKVYNNISELFRPGTTNEDITKAGAPILEAGYSGVCPLTWGIPGRGIDYPNAMLFDDPAAHLPEPFVLEPGMTVHLHTYPISLDFTKGVELAETWVITDGEPRCLNKYPRKLTII